MSRKEKNNGKPSRNNAAAKEAKRGSKAFSKALKNLKDFPLMRGALSLFRAIAGFFLRLPVAARIASAAAFLVIAGGVVWIVAVPGQIKLSVHESELPAFTSAFEAAWGKGFRQKLGITLVTYGKGDTLETTLGKADLVETAFGYNVLDAVERGKIRMVDIGKMNGVELPQALLQALAWRTSGVAAMETPGSSEADASSSEKPVEGAIGIPLSLNPYVAFWRRDRIGGVDAEPPSRYEDLFDAEGKPKNRNVLALAGSDDFARMANVLWLSTVRLRDMTTTRDIATFRAGSDALAKTASLGTFQNGAFSYGWSDCLYLLESGKVDGLFAPVSHFYNSGLEFRQGLRAGLLPLSSEANQRSCVAEIRLVLVSPKVGDSRSRALAAKLMDQRFQRALADARGFIPANLSGAFRDETAFVAISQARSSGLILVPAVPPFTQPEAARLSADSAAALRGAGFKK